MPERYYTATFTADELDVIFVALRRIHTVETKLKTGELIAYLTDVKEEGDRAMKEEQHEN